MRDQRANDPIQRGIQAEFAKRYSGIATYRIKVGEPKIAGVEEVENDHAAQLLMAFWLERPWEAVRKVRLFDDDYRTIFHHGITADHVYLAYLADKALEAAKAALPDDLRTVYASVRYALMGIIKALLGESRSGRELLDDPGSMLPAKRAVVLSKLKKVAAEAIGTLPYFVGDHREKMAEGGDLFDVKTAFKAQAAVREVVGYCVRDYKRGVERKRVEEFKI